MTQTYGLGAGSPADDDPLPPPVDEPPGPPLHEAVADDPASPFHAPVEVARESRDESLQHEADATREP